MPAPRPMPARLSPVAERLMSVAAVVGVTATTPLLELAVRRPTSVAAATVFATMAPLLATDRKRPAR